MREYYILYHNKAKVMKEERAGIKATDDESAKRTAAEKLREIGVDSGRLFWERSPNEIEIGTIAAAAPAGAAKKRRRKKKG